MTALLTQIRKRFTALFDKESKLLFKNSSWVFIANGTSTVFAFLRSVIIVRGLGAATLGHYTVAIAFVLTIQEILKLNVGMGIIRYGAQYRSAQRPDKMVALIKAGILVYLGSAAVSILVIGILLFFFYDSLIDTPGLAWFIFLYAVVNGISFLDNVSKGVLNLYYRFRINSVVQMGMDTLEFILIAACIYFFSNNLQYFFTTVIITRFANTVICNSAAILEMKAELGAYAASSMYLIRDQYREIREYVLGNSVSNTLKTFMNQGDVLILSAWTGPAAVGIYAVAKKLAYSVLAITDPLVKSIFPQLSMLVYEKKFNALKLMLRRITLLAPVPALLILVPAIIFRESLIELVYGKQFIPAASTFIIHLTGALQGSVFFWTLPLINSLGLTGLRYRIYLLAIAGGFMVAWVLTPFTGANGVAIGLLTANLIITGLFIWFAFKFIHRLNLTPGISIPAGNAMSIYEASSNRAALRHPVATFRFMMGKKKDLHRAIILDSAKYLFGPRYIRSKWESALDEIDRYDFITPELNSDFISAGNNLNTTFGKWIYCCTRVFAPLHMVETGVAHGSSSLIILYAMEKNGKGTLHSIDLPDQDTNEAYNFRNAAKTGWMIPAPLKHRWKLHIGDARNILPQLLNTLGTIDIFFHDSDHSYAHMQFEFDTVYPFLSASGFILSDDIHRNSAFSDFVTKHDLKALQFNKGGCALKH